MNFCGISALWSCARPLFRKNDSTKDLNMKYTDSHEWLEWEQGDVLRVGITDYAQRELGDIVYVELPSVGSQVNAKQEVAVLESTKAAVDIYSPVAGVIVEINKKLQTSPELINDSPDQEGWIYKVKGVDPVEVDPLMDQVAYEAMIKGG